MIAAIREHIASSLLLLAYHIASGPLKGLIAQGNYLIFKALVEGKYSIEPTIFKRVSL